MWYPLLKSVTFKSTWIELFPEFVEYILRDGVFQPEDEEEYEDQSDEEETKKHIHSEKKKIHRSEDERKAFLL